MNYWGCDMKWEERKKYYDRDYYDTEIKRPYMDWWWADASVWSPRAKAIYVACSPKTLLDCGCAKGSLVKYMVDLYGVDARGFDLSEYAITSTPYPEISNRLKVFDCAESDLPYKDKQFDVSVCMDFFEHQDNEHINHVVSEVERVTRSFIIIRQPFLAIDLNLKRAIGIFEGLKLEERYTELTHYKRIKLDCDPENIEHPNTVGKEELITLFQQFSQHEFMPYFYDVLMGATYSELTPVFPFYETLIMKRNPSITPA